MDVMNIKMENGAKYYILTKNERYYPTKKTFFDLGPRRPLGIFNSIEEAKAKIENHAGSKIRNYTFSEY